MRHTHTYIYIIIGFFFLSCSKNWLDKKPQNSLVVPETIADYQALLDNTTANGRNSGQVPFNLEQPGLLELGAGDFYISTTAWQNLPVVKQKNAYIWNSDIYGGEQDYIDWNYPYQNILFTNIIIEGIKEVKPLDATEISARNNVLGAALFFRAYSHYNLSQLFCKTYNPLSAETDPGIPLRITSNVNETSTRSNTETVYTQIIKDLKESLLLLPIEAPQLTGPLYRNRPTKAAANAMLSRVFLTMGKYDSTLVYSNKCLQQYNSLIDYNTLPLNSSSPFTRFNEEVILQNTLMNFSIFNTSRAIIDSNLYKLYDVDDLRKKAFFSVRNGNNVFKGTYDGVEFGVGQYFNGLATDEIILINAEANARLGNIQEALVKLNGLRIKRWNNQIPYSELKTNSAEECLKLVLLERRKELCFRGLRWTDLRRLNLDTRYQTTLKRVINNIEYILPPNDPKYQLPIPNNVINLSGMQQNPR